MKICTVWLLALALGASAAYPPSKISIPRLVGGTSAKADEFPYQVSLRRNGKLHCGGALISTRHVLTAAHCVTSARKPEFGRLTVVVGTNSLSAGGESYNVSDTSTHPDYVDKMLADWMYDVGVITLSSEVTLSKSVGTVDLPKTDVEIGSEAVVTGWGSMKGPVTPIPDKLKKLKLNIIDHKECKDRMPSFARVDPTHVCTFVSKGVGVCNRDSGGPLVQDGVVVGIVSGGVPCARGHPDIFTNVFTYLRYIERVMKLKKTLTSHVN